MGKVFPLFQFFQSYRLVEVIYNVVRFSNKSLKIEDGKRHADRDGLVLELRPNKKKLNKVFIFRFQWDKKPQTMTIGNYDSIGLKEARNIAWAYRDLVNKGIDPLIQNTEQQTKITFSVVAEVSPKRLYEQAKVQAIHTESKG